MMKKCIFLAAITIFSTAGFAQDLNKKIDAHANNPKTKENAAKADVFVVKKTISDSVVDHKMLPVASKKSASSPVKKNKSKKKSSGKN